MQYIYFGTIFAATLVYFFTGLLLLIQRKRGERSRAILAGMTLLSVLNYVGMLVSFFIDPVCHTDSIMMVSFLLIGIFVTTIYFMYPIEVISPGWITWKRLLKMYLPVVGLYLFYRVTQWLGVEYIIYPTLGEMMADIASFQVFFRIFLVLLMFLPALLLFYVPYTCNYNNSNRKWMRGYIAAITINLVSYLTVNIYDTYLSCSIYIIISIFCSLYIIYQELYVRLIRQPINEPQSTIEIESESVPIPEAEPDWQKIPKSRESELFERLEKYMNSTKAWQDPDLSAEKIVSALYTNRTSMLKAVKQHGYSGYSSYVNRKRVEEFIQIINRQGGFNYQETFYDVGFRSKTSALRNFKDITGKIPSKYFEKQNKNE